MHLQLRNLLNSGLMGTGRLHGKEIQTTTLNSVEIDIEQEKQMINTLLDALADAAVSQDSTFNFLVH